VKFRRLLFAALMGLCFDVVVPFEQTAQGTLAWEDDEEEALRADKRRQPGGAQRTARPARPGAAVAARPLVAARRRTTRPARRVRVSPVLHAAPPPPAPSPTEDH
jgi:hypothetical protein